jgi:ankyrin repeat protein
MFLRYRNEWRVDIERGNDDRGVVNGERTPLMVASDRGHTDIVSVLLAAGANVNARDNNGRSATDLARTAGHSHIVDMLTQAEARLESSAPSSSSSS